MNPLVVLAALMFLKKRGSAASSPPPRLSSPPSSAPVNGSTTTLKAGGLYRFKGTLSSEAPNPDAVKRLLQLVAGTNVRIGKTGTVAFTVRLPMDVPFEPGTAHPKAPWLTLEAATAVEPRAKK